jgi:hypothetical protein
LGNDPSFPRIEIRIGLLSLLRDKEFQIPGLEESPRMWLESLQRSEFLLGHGSQD